MWISKKRGLLVSTRTFYVLTPYLRVLGQTFPFFETELQTFPIIPSHFPSQSFPFFGVGSQSFPFSGSVLSFFWVRPSHIFESDLPISFSKLLFLISLSLFYSLWVWLDLTWSVSRKCLSLWKNWFRGDINKLFYAGFTNTEILEFLNVYHEQ